MQIQKLENLVFDAHCHYNKDLNLVRWATISGYNYDTNQKAEESAVELKKYFSSGLAPQEIQRSDIYPDFENEIKRISQQIDKQMKNPYFVAIGEIGLDNHWGKTLLEKERQKKAFERMLQIAKEKNLAVVVHSRNAEEECIEILIKEKIKKVLLHCFGGSLNEAKLAIENGFLISIPPIKSKERKKIIKEIELDFLVVESDAPYLGKTSLETIKSAEMIAEYKGINVEDVLKKTTENAQKFFAKTF
ncbi:MAG: TatD family hydrolase [Candidatus Anstonellaceae archaeon]